MGFLAAICAVALAFNVPQPLFLKGLLLPSACRCPFHCEVSFPASSDRCLDCLLRSFDLAKETREESSWWIQKLQVIHTIAFLNLPVFVAGYEHIKSKAVQLEGFPLPPRLQSFSSGSGAQWNIFSLLHFVCSPPHSQRMSLW